MGSDFTLIKEVYLDNWKDFLNIFDKYPKLSEKFIWRGQADSRWDIIASFFRDKTELSLSKDQNHYEYKYCYLEKSYNISERIQRHYYNFFHSINEIPLPLSDLSESLNFAPTNGVFSFSTGIPADIVKFCNENKFSSMISSNVDYSWGTRMYLKHWSWAQHYGVKTPLVDWTKFPFYALFFACDSISNSQSRTMYALNIDDLLFLNMFMFLPDFHTTHGKIDYQIKLLEQFFDIILGEQYKNFDIEKSSIDELVALGRFNKDKCKLKIISDDTTDNKRILRQGGLFSYTPLGIGLEDYLNRLTSFLRKLETDYPEWAKRLSILSNLKENGLLHKINIEFSEEERLQCLKYLNMMNINHSSIYPDFYGLAQSVNLADSMNNVSKIRTY